MPGRGTGKGKQKNPQDNRAKRATKKTKGPKTPSSNRFATSKSTLTQRQQKRKLTKQNSNSKVRNTKISAGNHRRSTQDIKARRKK